MGNDKIISLEDMYKMLHISKRKAKYMLDNGIIPCINTGKHTHRYLIKERDVLEYIKRETMFEYPKGIFGSQNRITEHKTSSLATIDRDYAIKWYQRHFAKEKSVLNIKDVIRLTGYSKSTIERWIAIGDLVGICTRKFKVFPKTQLINMMSSAKYLSKTQRSQLHDKQIAAMIKEKQ